MLIIKKRYMKHNIKEIVEDLVKVGWELSGEGFNHEYAGHSTSNPDDIEVIDKDRDARREVTKILVDLFDDLVKEIEEMKRVEKIEIKTKEGRDQFYGEIITIPYGYEETREIARKATLQDTITHLLRKKEEIIKLIK